MGRRLANKVIRVSWEENESYKDFLLSIIYQSYGFSRVNFFFFFFFLENGFIFLFLLEVKRKYVNFFFFMVFLLKKKKKKKKLIFIQLFS